MYKFKGSLIINTSLATLTTNLRMNNEGITNYWASYSQSQSELSGLIILSTKYNEKKLYHMKYFKTSSALAVTSPECFILWAEKTEPDLNPDQLGERIANLFCDAVINFHLKRYQ